MPKPDTETEYHVTLRSPMHIKLGGRSTVVRVFDATTDWSPGLLGDSIVFVTDRVWTGEGVSVVFKSSLTVPAGNIAGMVPQPFLER
jgi:hypothetical protein